MSNSLRNSITEYASRFAEQVLQAMRSASLEELLHESGRGASTAGPSKPGPGRPRLTDVAARPSRKTAGRKPRRSTDDIAGVKDQIISLLQQNSGGMRAEQIRTELGLQREQLARPIAEALAGKQIVKRGQKRATTYFAK